MKKYVFASLLCILLAAFMVIGCSDNSSPTAQAEKEDIQSKGGRNISLDMDEVGEIHTDYMYFSDNQAALECDDFFSSYNGVIPVPPITLFNNIVDPAMDCTFANLWYELTGSMSPPPWSNYYIETPDQSDIETDLYDMLKNGDISSKEYDYCSELVDLAYAPNFNYNTYKTSLLSLTADMNKENFNSQTSFCVGMFSIANSTVEFIDNTDWEYRTELYSETGGAQGGDPNISEMHPIVLADVMGFVDGWLTSGGNAVVGAVCAVVCSAIEAADWYDVW